MKKLLCFLSAVMLLVFFGGCGKEIENIDTDNYTVNLDIDKNTAADISILVPGGNSNETTMITKAIEGFNLIYPNVSIAMNYISVNSYENTIRNLSMAGTLDDIIWTNSPDFYYLVSKNLALNLNPCIDASEKAGVFDLEDDFLKEFFDIASLSGKLYAIPRSADSVVTFYNEAILTAAGVDMQTVVNGWSWETFMDACAKVRTYFDNNGMSDRYVLDANLTVWLSTSYPMLRSFGADVADSEGNITIDSQQTRDCISLVRDMVEKRYICESIATSGSSFEAGTSAFLFQSASVSLYANRKDLKGKIDIVSFPLINVNNSPKIGSGIAGYSISSTTKQKDICWAFLNYLISYDGQQNMALGGLNLPSIRKDLQDYTTANWGAGYTDFNLNAYLYGNNYKITEDFLAEFDPQYKADLQQAVKDLFNNASNKNKTIDECMATVVRDINDALGA